MKWLRKLLGINTPLEKKKKALSNLRVQAVMAQRNGDLKRYAALSKKAEGIEDEIVEMLSD
tara:strand:- start:4006 stop:4188 length:183 start_codon:yes stop_codon:yes gene_type:complete